MNDDLMFDYLLQMGAMRPEQDELKRKQAMVEALRGRAMEQRAGQMVGKHYVAPGLADIAAQMGQAYFAKQGQAGVDSKLGELNTKQGSQLRALRDEAERRRRQQLGAAPGGSAFGMDRGFEDPTAY